MVAVISLNSQTFLGHNQETYQDLRLALQLNLRRQLLIAVCDDVGLQLQCAQRLEADLSPYPAKGNSAPSVRAGQSPVVTLRLDGSRPDLVREVLLWLKQQRRLQGSTQTIPAFQILGIETLTRQSPTIQNRFLASLVRVDALLTQLDCRLIVWLPRPWLGKIRQSVPGFWRSRSGLFEFAGEPTSPLPELAAGVPFSPQQPAPEQFSPSAASRPSAGSKPDADSAHLWTVLREDLSGFEQRLPPSPPAVAPTPPAQPVPEPQPVSPEPAPPAVPASTAAALPLPASPPSGPGLSSLGVSLGDFTVVTDQPRVTVVMPPWGDLSLTDLAQDLAQPEVAPGELADLLQGPPVSSSDPARSSQPDPLPIPVPAQAVSRSRPSEPPVIEQTAPGQVIRLPAELADDLEIVTLWEDLQTLAVQQAGPLTLARAFLALGQLSRDRVEADSQSMAMLDFAMAVYTPAIAGLPEGTTDWCDALNDLASLYWLRSQLETDSAVLVGWLNGSVEAYQQALGGGQHSASADTLSRIYSNLGTVYGLLATFTDPVPCLTDALGAYHQALRLNPPDRSPLDYANLQNSLGAIHWRLSQLDRPQPHLHGAITAYTEALRQRSPQTEPQEYAMIQNNLGIAYWSLAQHERPIFLLEQAIAAYQGALAYRTLATSAAGCAATHNNLGTAYWDLAQHQTKQPDRRLVSLEKAVAAYSAALDAAETALGQMPQPALGFDIWATFHSAGVVHDQIAQGLPADQLGRRQHHLREALQHYLLAYQGWRDDPPQLEVLAAALVYTVQLNFEILGIAAQQEVLSQVPGELLPKILRQLQP